MLFFGLMHAPEVKRYLGLSPFVLLSGMVGVPLEVSLLAGRKGAEYISRFLASDTSSYMAGHVIVLDSGAAATGKRVHWSTERGKS